jgi:uncharacterized protein
MVRRIEQDRRRFEDIVKGRIKQDLQKYITRGEMLGKRGREVVSIPVPHIEPPRFRFGAQERGGVGQGPGEPGQPIGGGQPGDGSGTGAGDEPGQHVREVEISIDEMTQLLGEALELPRIEPRGSETLSATRGRYTGIRNIGPESLRSFRRTYREALKREIATGTYDPARPVVTPVKGDMRYRSRRDEPLPVANAVIVYMMDVSGSMADEQKEIVRIQSFWIDQWIRAHYQGIETRFIIHDAQAREVDRETFFTTRESGGTKISSAYLLAADLVESEFPVADWNVYLFHFSDGDNLSSSDNEVCFTLLRERLLPVANLFGYAQVESRAGSGVFLGALTKNVEAENLIVSRVRSRDAILGSIKELLGTGR